MFVGGTGRSGDRWKDTSAFEEYHNPTPGLPPYDAVSIYTNALLWVCTVLTTVGYGGHTYGTSNELMFAMGLEIISTLWMPIMIMLFLVTDQISDYSHKKLI